MDDMFYMFSTVPFPEPHKEKFNIPFKANANIPWPVHTLSELDKRIKKPKAKKEHLGAVKPPPRDNVNLPHHYARYKIEPIRFSIENELDGFQFNIVKYTLRHKFKNKREDLNKAVRYLEMYIKYEYDKDPNWWKA